jgi:hypothetical protein
VNETVGRIVIFVAALAVIGCGTVLNPAFYEARTGEGAVCVAKVRVL